MTMKIHNLIQGSPEWMAHRATHFNASDAPAMLGCSPYSTRTELLQRLKTGIAQEVDAATQRRFDDGHRFEALARPLAEKIIGDDLYPITGSFGELSASFDGLTLDNGTAFEHKSLNQELREVMEDGDCAPRLPLQYRVQMEQQSMVSGADKVLFMASKWGGETLIEERHCWYNPDPQLRAQIVAGWKQFAEDLATYVPPAAHVVEKLVAESVEALPAPVVQVTGQLALTDNFKAFEQRLHEFLDTKLIRAPKTDEDFVNLDAQIKAMKAGREALKSAKAQMLAQVQPVDQANKTADMLDKLLQQNCSMAETLLKDEKERRKIEIVASGQVALKQHFDALNTRLGKPYMPAAFAQADFGGAMRNLRSLASMEDAVSTLLAKSKIAANEVADRIALNLATLREKAAAHAFLFADTAQLVLKQPDDLAAIVTARISEHEAAEAKKKADADAETQRLIKEASDAAAAKATAEAEAETARKVREAVAAAQTPVAAPVAPVLTAVAPVAALAPAVVQLPARTAAPAAPAPLTAPTLTIGAINDRLGGPKVDGAFLSALGFVPTVAKASRLYYEAQFPLICAALVAHIEAVQAQQAA